MELENAFDAINGEFNKFLEKFDLLYCIIIFTWIVYAWETYLSQRQVKYVYGFNKKLVFYMTDKIIEYNNGIEINYF